MNLIVFAFRIHKVSISDSVMSSIRYSLSMTPLFHNSIEETYIIADMDSELLKGLKFIDHRVPTHSLTQYLISDTNSTPSHT